MDITELLAFSAKPEIFMSPAKVILAIFLLLALYEIWFIAKLSIIKALRT